MKQLNLRATLKICSKVSNDSLIHYHFISDTFAVFTRMTYEACYKREDNSVVCSTIQCESRGEAIAQLLSENAHLKYRPALVERVTLVR